MTVSSRKEELLFAQDPFMAFLKEPLIRYHALLWAVVGFVLLALLWAYCAIIDEVTHAEGKVVPSSRMQIIQNLEGGIVKEILVKVGDPVSEGDVLIKLDDTQYTTQYRELLIHQAALEAKLVRLKAESQEIPLEFPSELSKNFPTTVQTEIDLYHTRQEELRIRLEVLEGEAALREQEFKEITSRVKSLEERLGFLQKELDMAEKLFAQKVISEAEILRMRRQLSELSSELETATISVPKVESAIAQTKARIHELTVTFKTEAQAALTNTEQDLAKISEELKSINDRLKRTVVQSPVSGRVNVVHVNTLGGTINPGQPLVEVVPSEDSLFIEARVRPQDIGFLHIGQEAMVKLTAYDFSIYGGLPGAITRISPSTVQTEKGDTFYQIQVETKNTVLKSRGQELPIIPGMHASVDVITGRKSVLDYLLKPILKTKERAMRER